MKKIILDTHIFLWSLSDPEKINDGILKEIETPINRIYISSISIAEIMIKYSLNKLNIDCDILKIADETGFEFLDFTVEDAVILKNLPYHHKDPFDRMLIAQSIVNDYYIISDDSKFKLYNCKLL